MAKKFSALFICALFSDLIGSIAPNRRRRLRSGPSEAVLLAYPGRNGKHHDDGHSRRVMSRFRHSCNFF